MEKTPLYREVANRITTLVAGGTFKIGDRLPSIREMSRQAQVSINTVKVAYSYLEDRCLIEARPQSGYYICPRPLELPREPTITPEGIEPQEINSGTLVARLLQDMVDSRKVQFGAAIPDPQLIPAQKLGRILSVACRNHPGESAGYATSPGHKRLRNQIARWMLKAGCTLNPDELIITNGAAEAVFLALQVLCKPGDTVAIGSPIYFNFVQMLQLLGLRVIEIPNSPTEGLHLESLRQALRTNTIACCMVISNFDNPLGSSLSDDKKRQLAMMLAEARVPLIEDDINGDLSFNDERPSVAKAWDRDGNILLCSSFSKTLAPGYRVGWIAPGRYLEAIHRLKLVINIACVSPTQLAIADFLADGGYAHHLRRIRKAYATKLARMADAIGRYFPAGTRVTRPAGGFVLWLELPGEVDTVALYSRAEAEKIVIAPGRIFSTRDKYRNCLRLNGAFWSEENRWAVESLGRIAGDLCRESS
ncbi:MAG: PLP-dependent aminotransferase family protein [Desulforhopalus sp.]|nr:PLP-dependent aminotransferase family protein [Desulforhopalus sp.]